MTWLVGWGKRIQITINYNLVDGALTDFPVLIHLSKGSGINGRDTTRVFDEVGANDKKIAITIGDGQTECYVEIEKWDSGNEEAWLWTKIPAISDTADTNIFLYYDNTHADNATYVGDTNSAVAENVWDANFMMVLHMAETAGTSYDSTTNDNDGTVVNAVTQNAVGKINGADDFDGISGHLHIADHATLDLSTAGTVECLFKFDVYINSGGLIHKGDLANFSDEAYSLQFWSNQYRIGTYIKGVPADLSMRGNTSTLTNGVWYHASLVWGATGFKLYLDGAQDATSGSTITVDNTTGGINIGTQVEASNYYPFNGIIDEVRISNIARSAEWLKATYESGRDNFLYYHIPSMTGIVRGNMTFS